MSKTVRGVVCFALPFTMMKYRMQSRLMQSMQLDAKMLRTGDMTRATMVKNWMPTTTMMIMSLNLSLSPNLNMNLNLTLNLSLNLNLSMNLNMNLGLSESRNLRQNLSLNLNLSWSLILSMSLDLSMKLSQMHGDELVLEATMLNGADAADGGCGRDGVTGCRGMDVEV